MIRINLLPHRELKRKALQQQIVALAGVVSFFGLVVVWGVHMVIESKIDYQNSRNQFMTTQIAILDTQISEIRDIKSQLDELLTRKSVVETLQSSRSEVVYLLDQLVRLLPDGVYLKDIKQDGRGINLVGYAQSNAWVSSLMRNLESSPWLHSPVLVEIKAVTVDDVRQNEFSLNIELVQPSGEDDVEE